MKTILDTVRETQPQFVKEWQPYGDVEKKVKRKILRYFMNHKHTWQPTNDTSSKQPFNVFTFTAIDNKLGLAYTSTGAYAGLWCCNGGYLWADDTHYFIGFAVDVYGDVYAIADDKDENSIYIKL